jgi:hypothetical protein
MSHQKLLALSDLSKAFRNGFHSSFLHLLQGNRERWYCSTNYFEMTTNTISRITLVAGFFEDGALIASCEPERIRRIFNLTV